jgi:hypothetical protein
MGCDGSLQRNYALYARAQHKVKIARKIGVMTKEVRTEVMRICKVYRIVISEHQDKVL